MKRLKKQLAKAEKRAQKKEARRAAKGADTTASVNPNTSTEPVAGELLFCFGVTM